jgi:hypothetical protein
MPKRPDNASIKTGLIAYARRLAMKLREELGACRIGHAEPGMPNRACRTGLVVMGLPYCAFRVLGAG